MTLEEAIEHCEEVADKKVREKQKWERWLENDSDYRAVAEKVSCELCAEEHRQLAEWLKELKGYREAKAEIESLPLVWEYGQGVEDCLAIIDKHLQEVTTDEDRN